MPGNKKKIDKKFLQLAFDGKSTDEKNKIINSMVDHIKSRIPVEYSLNDLLKFLSILPDDLDWYQEFYNLFPDSYLTKLENEFSKPVFSINKSGSLFRNSYGCLIEFRNDFKDEVNNKFPFLKEYIETALGQDANLFFLNALILEKNSEVKKHVDTSMKRHNPGKIQFPLRVSVLYVDLPEMVGGELCLYKYESGELMTKIIPERGKLVIFKGNLPHSVSEIANILTPQKGKRISLICEQYRVDSETLNLIPGFTFDFPNE
jgi:hypothetical protein